MTNILLRWAAVPLAAAVLVVSAAFAASCTEEITLQESSFVEDSSDEICFVIKGQDVFNIDWNNWQISWDSGTRTFRATDDELANWFAITLPKSSLEKGQTIRAQMKWVTVSSSHSGTDMSFKIISSNNNIIKMWDRKDQVGLVIKTL